MNVQHIITKWRPKIGRFYDQNKTYFLNAAMDKEDLEQELAIRLWKTLAGTNLTGDALEKLVYSSIENDLKDLLQMCKRQSPQVMGEKGPEYSALLDFDEMEIAQDGVWPDDLFDAVKPELAPQEYEFVEVMYGRKKILDDQDSPIKINYANVGKWFGHNEMWAIRMDRKILKKLRPFLKKR